MFPVIFGLVVCALLALVVIALVAIPARREGRDVLISRSERVLMRVPRPQPVRTKRFGRR